jgi:hypothetical protein
VLRPRHTCRPGSNLAFILSRVGKEGLGAQALSKAIRRTVGAAAAIQRCQVHKARNIMERLPKSLHSSVRRTAAKLLAIADEVIE